MKARIIILVAVTAVVTLSFTFASSSNQTKKAVASEQPSKSSGSEPAGGFVVDDKF